MAGRTQRTRRPGERRQVAAGDVGVGRPAVRRLSPARRTRAGRCRRPGSWPPTVLARHAGDRGTRRARGGQQARPGAAARAHHRAPHVDGPCVRQRSSLGRWRARPPHRPRPRASRPARSIRSASSSGVHLRDGPARAHGLLDVQVRIRPGGDLGQVGHAQHLVMAREASRGCGPTGSADRPPMPASTSSNTSVVGSPGRQHPARWPARRATARRRMRCAPAAARLTRVGRQQEGDRVGAGRIQGRRARRPPRTPRTGKPRLGERRGHRGRQPIGRRRGGPRSASVAAASATARSRASAAAQAARSASASARRAASARDRAACSRTSSSVSPYLRSRP